MSEIAFTKVKLPYGWMGNMAPFPLVYLDKEWRTSEALFQAMRFAPDNQVRELIRNEKSPMSAKMVAHKYADQMIVMPRSDEDVAQMGDCIVLKIGQHPKLEQELLATGDAMIIEDCSNRQNESGLFWGAARTDTGWTGDNKLGNLWMSCRGILSKFF